MYSLANRHTPRSRASRSLLIGAALASLLLSPIEAAAQGVPIEASLVSPTVMIVLDTSGGMEFLPYQPTGPDVCACVSPYDDVCDVPHREPKLTNSGELDSAYYTGAKTRYHQALEVIGGTIENFYCLWDFRDTPREAGEPDRVDMFDGSRPQGFPHAMACSYRGPKDPNETDEEYYARSCGQNIIQRDNGVLQNNRELARFGLAGFDSFPEPGAGPGGMFSYACDPNLPGIPAEGSSLCLGIRNNQPGAEAGMVMPNPSLPSTDVGPLLDTLRYVVPYWSSPLAAALHDVRWMYQNEPMFQNDPFGQCRDHNVIMITDGLDNFDVCVNDRSFPGCANYWYPPLVDGEDSAANQLYRNTTPAGQDISPSRRTNLYTVGYALDEAERAVSRLPDLWTFNHTGIEGIPESYLHLYADSATQLQLQLSAVISSVLQDHVVSRTPPVITTRTRGFVPSTSGDSVARSRFEGRSYIRDGRPFWAGTILRIDTVCREDMNGNRSLYDVDETNAVDFSRILDTEIADAGGALNYRRILTIPGATLSHPALNTAHSLFEYTPDIPETLEDELEETELDASCIDTGASLANCRRLQGNLGFGNGTPYSSTVSDNGWYGFYTADMDGDDEAVFKAGANFNWAGTLGLPTVSGTNQPIGELIRWVWGYTLAEIKDWGSHQDSPLFIDLGDDFDYENQDRISAVGDMLYSAPVLVPAPQAGVPFQGYDAFLDEPIEAGEEPRRVWQRPSVLYVGSNAGMLHAFDASDGEELWAYIPSILHRSLIDTAQGRRAMVDGSPQVMDMRVFRGVASEGGEETSVDLWRTILVGGLRSGGRGYYALDVTNPYEPQFLWEFDHRKDPRLGLTYGDPALATIYLENCHEVVGGPERHIGRDEYAPASGGAGCERAVAILPGGQTPEPVADFPNTGRALYVVDIITGQVLRRFTTVITKDSDPVTTCHPEVEHCLPAGLQLPFCHSDPSLGLAACEQGTTCVGEETNPPSPVAGPHCRSVGAMSLKALERLSLPGVFQYFAGNSGMTLSTHGDDSGPPNEILGSLTAMDSNLAQWDLCMPYPYNMNELYLRPPGAPNSGPDALQTCLDISFKTENATIPIDIRGLSGVSGEPWVVARHLVALSDYVDSGKEPFFFGIFGNQDALTEQQRASIINLCSNEGPPNLSRSCACVVELGDNICHNDFPSASRKVGNLETDDCIAREYGGILFPDLRGTAFRTVRVRGVEIPQDWITSAGVACNTGCNMETQYVPGRCVPDTALDCSGDGECPAPNLIRAPIPSALTGSAMAFDVNAGGRATRAFMGDAAGRMLRLDLSSGDPDEWDLDIFFDPSNLDAFPDVSDRIAANPRPVRFKPVIAYRASSSADDETYQAGGKAVIIYGMGDTDSLETATDANFVFSISEEPVFGTDGQMVRTDADINWIIELEPGEKLTARPRIFNRTTYFATYVPNADPCEIGDPRLYGVDYIGQLGVAGLSRYLSVSDIDDPEMEDNPSHVVIGRLPSPEALSSGVAGNHYYWDPQEEGGVFGRRSILTSIDFVSMPACLIVDDSMTDQEYAAQTSSSGLGDLEMVLSSSSAGGTGAEGGGGDSVGASSVRSAGVTLPQPEGMVVPTSWGTSLPW